MITSNVITIVFISLMFIKKNSKYKKKISQPSKEELMPSDDDNNGGDTDEDYKPEKKKRDSAKNGAKGKKTLKSSSRSESECDEPPFKRILKTSSKEETMSHASKPIKKLKLEDDGELKLSESDEE